MLRRTFAFACTLVVLAGFWGQAMAARPRAASFQPMLDILEAPSVQPILEALDKAKLSGSFVFSGRCDLRECKPLRPIAECFPDFPQFRAPATRGGSTVQTLREVLADAPAMQVTQDTNGTVRMNESGVPTDLLNIRISHILFESNGANGQRDIYTANDALRFILQAPEVIAFMKVHDIGGPFDNNAGSGGSVPGNSGAWPPDSPHISGSLDNVTLSEALDHVLKTFPGIWIYENCPQIDKKKRVVYFRFLALHKVAGRAFVVAD